jgi:formate C-acetyltransferase
MEVRSMGRFDLLYNEFYLADLAAGRLTREQAKELLKYFWIKFFAKSMGKRFGKPFLFGPDANEFSQLALDAYHEMRIEDPKLHIRIAKRTSPAFVEQVARCIEDGCTSMVIGNDDAQVKMLCEQGKTPEDANEYIFIGCYEPAIQGKELNCSGAATLNLAKAVEQTLASDYPTFEAFLAGYLGVLEGNLELLADRVRRWERLWPQISPTPFLGGTMPSCLERGLDISEAGAKYNTSGVCCIGLADAVDSLAAVRQLVYEDQNCTLAELRDALAVDWQGYDELRLTVRHRVPKWGNNDESVDRLAVAVTGFIGPRINREPNARNGRFQAALYGILPTVQGFGKNTGALPNGRRAGEHLTVNTGASVGMNRQGVTALVNSVTKIDLTQFPNGTVLDIMLHPSALAGDQGWQTVAAVIRSHFAQGGLAIQFNIFDPAILREAKAFPEKHADLQVRVCGWNVLFSNLRPEEQDLFIAKAEAVL